MLNVLLEKKVLDILDIISSKYRKCEKYSKRKIRLLHARKPRIAESSFIYDNVVALISAI